MIMQAAPSIEVCCIRALCRLTLQIECQSDALAALESLVPVPHLALQGSSLAQGSSQKDREHSCIEASILNDMQRPAEADFDASRSIDGRLGAAFMHLKFSSPQFNRRKVRLSKRLCSDTSFGQRTKSLTLRLLHLASQARSELPEVQEAAGY